MAQNIISYTVSIPTDVVVGVMCFLGSSLVFWYYARQIKIRSAAGRLDPLHWGDDAWVGRGLREWPLPELLVLSSLNGRKY